MPTYYKTDPGTGLRHPIDADNEHDAEEAWFDYQKNKRNERVTGGPMGLIETESKARQAGRQAGGGEQGALTALNGLLMGFGDEAVGGIEGLVTKASGGEFGEGYQRGRDYARGATEQYRQDQPVLGPTADIAGGLAGAPASVLKAAAGAGRIGRAAVAAGTGGVQGAVQGAGEAETLGDVPGKALTGGLLGTVLGAGAHGAGAVGGGIVNAVRSRLPEGGIGGVLPKFTGSNAFELAMRRVGNALVRDESSAARAGARMKSMGDEATIADASGDSALGLLDTIATLPGKTKGKVETLIHNRARDRATRMGEVPDSLSKGRPADETFDALEQAKRAAAAPLYAKVDVTNVPSTAVLTELAERPSIKRAIDQARLNAADQGRTLPDLVPGQPMPLRFWDEVKRGLDDTIYNVKRSTDTNKATITVNNARENKLALVSELDRLTTGKNGRSIYKDARDAYAGPTALQDAIEDGANVVNMSASEIKRATFRMSASELEAYRIGAAQAIREKTNSPTGQNQLLNIWKDRNVSQRLQAIFGEETAAGRKGYREALSTLLAEGRMKKMESVGRNSKTVSREAGIEDLNAGVLGDAKKTTNVAADVAQLAGSVVTWNKKGTFDAARSLGGRLGTPEVVRDEVGRILMQRGLKGQELLKSMDAIIKSMQMGNSQAAAIQGVLGGSLMNP